MALLAYNASMSNQTLIEIILCVHFRTDIVHNTWAYLGRAGLGQKAQKHGGPSGHGSSLNRTNLKPRTGPAVRPRGGSTDGFRAESGPSIPVPFNLAGLIFYQTRDPIRFRAPTGTRLIPISCV
jgi:hypothetical protein